MNRSVEYYLIRLLATIGIIAVVGVLVILPYRLYERDVRNAKVQAHQISSIVHTSLSEAIIEGRDITDLVNRLQGNASFVMKLQKLEKGEVHPAMTSGRGYSKLNGTELSVTTPPIVDKDKNTWLASMEFDLSNMKRESISLIIDLMLAVVFGSLCFSIAVYILIRKFLVVPPDFDGLEA